ncbi:DinB family protein [Acidicapsa dinghuensis]|uniref:DinB family protein n=1 Tax=Acidicapsa dinghuensis TaxID=2218256 RepID=A0ABW1EFF8_9BACT|nr:DinB family protein [Acidicapsa dinghuensis]
MKKLFALMLLTVALPCFSQTTDKDVLLKHWKTSGDLTIAVANAMPSEGYSFRPVPAEMSFGELMVHIAAADRNACANASGLTAPALPAKVGDWTKDLVKADVDKETAVQFLQDTFAFCQKAITEMPASNMATVVGPANRHLMGSEWLWSYFTHTAHHRGQAEVYLRLKGITPPTYAF